MIEIADPLDDMERHFIVALCAGLSEFVLVRIRMAAGAVSEVDSCKLLEANPVPDRYGMALFTGDLLVAAFKYKPRRSVIEAGSRLEGIIRVAIRTSGAQCLLVKINVTGNA